MKIAYVNGAFLPESDAKISIFDRGFLFGDGVYEVIPVYKNTIYFFEQHLNRLYSSLRDSKISLPDCSLQEIGNELVRQNKRGDFQIYLQITRGNQGLRKHDIPENLPPTVVAFTLDTPFPTESQKRYGLDAKLVDDFRWHKCQIKSTSLIANILLNDEAVSAGAQTALLLRDGLLTEGGTSNVFILDEGGVKTPPLNEFCLSGVTRQITIKLLEQLNIPFNEQTISRKDLFKAQEIWITSTTKEIYPLRSIDNQIIGSEQRSEIWHKINHLYQNLVRQ